MKENTQCVVCGSTGSILRSGYKRGSMWLCYGHEAVCWDHKKDPCPVCDVADDERLIRKYDAP